MGTALNCANKIIIFLFVFNHNFFFGLPAEETVRGRECSFSRCFISIQFAAAARRFLKKRRARAEALFIHTALLSK
jgi:hypothetical protein